LSILVAVILTMEPVAAEEGFSDVLVPKRSPAGVFVQAGQYIEAELGKKNAAMQRVFQKARDLATSACAKKLLLQKGTRLAQEHGAQQKMWVDFIKKRLDADKTETSPPPRDDITPDDPKNSKVAANLKDTPLFNLKKEIVTGEYVETSVQLLMAMTEFQQGYDEWAKSQSSRKIKLSKKYESVVDAFGLPQQFNGQDISGETLTLDRLVRAFRGTFVVSPGEHRDRFARCLVRADSAFMENVILIKGVGRGKLIPVNAVYAVDKTGLSTTDQVTRFAPESSVIYLDIALEFVLTAMQETEEELYSIFTESEDDVI
jgi:hypothetical protein